MTNEQFWRERADELAAALEPFSAVLRGYTHQKDNMPIVAGFHASDLRWKLVLGDFRRACEALAAYEAGKSQ